MNAVEPLFIDKVAWTPVRDRKLLFARSKNQTLFYNVSGKRKPRENDFSALLREVREEVGVALLIPSVRFLRSFSGETLDGVPLQILCYDAKYVGEFTTGHEVEELAWFTSGDKHRTTPMGGKILDWFKAQKLID